MRYSELKRSLNANLEFGLVSDRTLSGQLRELEASGLITRAVFPVVPPHTEYTITTLGRAAIPCLKALQGFGNQLKAHLGARDISE